ncbi:beta-lactamase/transpeptidase-like protein [Dactylonectria estremocensis]|uniref:Beta-lactamase/transpeptidase-like protein n=1 Tax=Dactylonectria estremocensis TaxID=1079267 RepID=A0A9P9JEM7_9HYPO|nr:beta-lactamase/transpeptidase-like protein [Dactylonectria estremocensis]
MDFFHSEKFRSLVEDLMCQHHVPGLAIAVVQNDKIASRGYGMASIEPPVPCSSDTLFDVASCAKSLTAASVALLIEDNENFPEVQYDAIMSSLLPDDFLMPGVGYTENVTVEDILSHRTGMAAHNNSYMGAQASRPDDARSITRNLRNLPVAAPLRTKYIYCNMMYTVATHLVEVKTQQSFSDFLEERFFQPLDMKSTSLQAENARAKGLGDRIARGYHWYKDKSTYRAFQSPDCPEGQGAGSIVTSVNDFAKWIQALMNCKSPINEQIYQGLIRMRSFVNPNARRLKPYSSPAVYGAGLEVHYYRGHMVVGHNGMVDGFGSRFFFLPGFNFGAVIVGNSTGAGPIGTILARDVMDEILQVPGADRPRRQKSKTPRSTTKGDASNPKHQFKDGGEKQRTVKENDSRAPNVRVGHLQPQTTPLDLYIGKYLHPGYHDMIVQIRGDKLFIDAMDRSLGFTLTFEHKCEQTEYTAYLGDLLEDQVDSFKARFVFEDGKAVKLGLDLEPVLREMIWFQKVEEA